mmetsp:Transcript_3088/g.8845  ORF Transcript_3088/g.8845 Transcript_3088/m.8845 type:complete len:211 (-) Transcript_3088:222-854(-)
MLRERAGAGRQGAFGACAGALEGVPGGRSPPHDGEARARSIGGQLGGGGRLDPGAAGAVGAGHGAGPVLPAGQGQVRAGARAGVDRVLVSPPGAREGAAGISEDQEAARALRGVARPAAACRRARRAGEGGEGGVPRVLGRARLHQPEGPLRACALGIQALASGGGAGRRGLLRPEPSAAGGRRLPASRRRRWRRCYAPPPLAAGGLAGV